MVEQIKGHMQVLLRGEVVSFGWFGSTQASGLGRSWC